MQKSKYVFVIMAIVYTTMGIFSHFEVLEIHRNILFALSVSALLISIGEIFAKISLYLYISNDYCACLKVTIDFLDEKILANQINPHILNTRNYTENIKRLLKGNYKYCHPYEYSKKKLLKFLNFFSSLAFVIGIASFIIIPLVKQEIGQEKTTTMVTFLAFATISFSLFLDELINSINSEKNALIQDKHLLIQEEYPDFLTYFQFKIFYQLDSAAFERMKKAERND